MLFAAAGEHQIDLSCSWMIGDSEKDVAAGRSAGSRTARILRPGLRSDANANVIAGSLLDATRQILRWDEEIAERRTMDSAQA
jgi:D-glycero-D-manno-heptose 1,7-bisphosphate phosphatase